jgi:hypothetical protein
VAEVLAAATESSRWLAKGLAPVLDMARAPGQGSA